jgi:hypothetical protein
VNTALILLPPIILNLVDSANELILYFYNKPMSGTYNYLFKYIIVGETSRYWYSKSRCRKVMPAIIVHRSEIS